MRAPVVDILMYHSIAEAPGPTSIAPAHFAAQMAALAEAGVPVIGMNDLLRAHEGRLSLAPYSVVITFDDGFRDFALNAAPVLQEHGFGAMVYLPTDAVGRHESWPGAHRPPRQLMSWHEVRRLASAGFDFGSHTVSHADLPTLPDEALEAELRVSRAILEDRLGRPIRHFAPPYGRTDRRVQAAIGRHYRSSVTTRLGSAGPGNDPLALPRLEMFYFTDPARWRAHLQGRGRGYLAARRVLRGMRQSFRAPWQ